MDTPASGQGNKIQIIEADLHPHLRARMTQRGVNQEQIEQTLNEDWEATDAKPGTLGKTMVFSYEQVWEEKFHQEKEVTVYYKWTAEGIILLTVKARYGQGFPRR